MYKLNSTQVIFHKNENQIKTLIAIENLGIGQQIKGLIARKNLGIRFHYCNAPSIHHERCMRKCNVLGSCLVDVDSQVEP